MLPITHTLYLASGLFLLGLATVLLRRAPGRVLLGVVLMLAAPGLLLASFARAWGHTGGQVLAALLLVLVAVYAAVGAALLRTRREHE
jgi:NADH-quinone oxidoreductase subunit K